MKKLAILSLLLLIALGGFSNPLRPIDLGGEPGPDLFPNGTKVAIKNNLGRYMSICKDCESFKYSSIRYSASFHYPGAHPRASEIFTLVKVGDKYAFKAFNGQYLALCEACESTENLTLITGTPHTAGQPFKNNLLFSLEAIGGGKYRIKASNNKFCTRYYLKNGDKKHVLAGYYGKTDREAGEFIFEVINPAKKFDKTLSWFASGDPQYDFRELEVKDGKTVAKSGTNAAKTDLAFVRMFQKMDNNPGKYKGIIIAGDLTARTKALEFDHYKEIIKHRNKSADIYEGLGNHDYENARPGDMAKCTIDWGSCHVPMDLIHYIRNKKRNTPVNMSTETDRQFLAAGGALPVNWNDDLKTPHYSWDWNGVHFVQLNLYPGDGQGVEVPYSDEPGHDKYYLNPLKSLRFLKADLAKHVGNSPTPVVIIHHYGMENFSHSWWEESERAAYWDALAPYNVIGILSGHLHTPGENYHTTWQKPATATKLNRYYDKLNNFLTGGMTGGYYYMDFEIENGNLETRKFKEAREITGSFKSFPINMIPIH